jgi:hypothetical protein
MTMADRKDALARNLLSPFLSALSRSDGDGLTPELRAEYLAEFENGLGKTPEPSAERTAEMQMLTSRVEPQIWRHSTSA